MTQFKKNKRAARPKNVYFSAPFRTILDRKYNEKDCQQISAVLRFASAKMTLTKEGKAIIELLFKEKGRRGRRIVKKFPSKKGTHTSFYRPIRKIQKTGTTDRINGIDRFSNNETRIMINNFSLRGLILMKLKI